MTQKRLQRTFGRFGYTWFCAVTAKWATILTASEPQSAESEPAVGSSAQASEPVSPQCKEPSKTIGRRTVHWMVERMHSSLYPAGVRKLSTTACPYFTRPKPTSLGGCRNAQYECTRRADGDARGRSRRFQLTGALRGRPRDRFGPAP